ncbi:hypothetical protein AZ09_04335 [Acetobacter aceti 1023]|nr:hypothetical protein AZ09_04335 [Acetobacter aceti 1023]
MATPLEQIGGVVQQLRTGAQLFAQPKDVTVLSCHDRQEAADWFDRMASELEAAFTLLRMPVQTMPEIIDVEFQEVRS